MKTKDIILPATVIRAGRDMNACTATGFRARLRDAARAGSQAIIADLSITESLDPATAGAIKKAFRQAGADGRLCGAVAVSGPVTAMLAGPGRARVTVAGSVDDLVRAWRAARDEQAGDGR